MLTLTDEPPEEVREMLERLAPHTTNGSVTSFGWLAIRDFRPFTLVLDRQGVLRDYFFGEQSYPNVRVPDRSRYSRGPGRLSEGPCRCC